MRNPSVERLRSNISSKLPTRANYHSRTADKIQSNDYNLSYRRPLLSDDCTWEDSSQEEEEGDDVTPLTPGSSEGGKYLWSKPRTPRSNGSPRHYVVSTAVKKPVKKVLSAVTSLPSLRGNHSPYTPKNDDTPFDDETESRDDCNDHRYLLRSMQDEKLEAVHHREFISKVDEGPTKSQQQQQQQQPTESVVKRQEHHPQQPHHRTQGSRKSFKQLLHINEDESMSDLRVVDFGGFRSSGSSGSSSEKENKTLEYTTQTSTSSTVASAEAVVGETNIRDSLVVSSSSGSDANEKQNAESEKKAHDGEPEDGEHAIVSDEKHALEKNNDPLESTTTAESLAGLKVSELSSDRTSSDGSGSDHDFVRMSTNEESLAGLKISQASESARASEAFAAANATHTPGSILGYSTGSNTEIYEDDNSLGSSRTEDYYDQRSLETNVSASTVDFDGHLTKEEKAAGVTADIPGNDSGDSEGGAGYIKNTLYSNNGSKPQHPPLHPTTPVESSVMTGGQQSYVTYVSARQSTAYPVAVTPTENGDVILLTPLDDVLDIGPQPTLSASTAHTANASKAMQAQATTIGSKPAKLMIPSLNEGNPHDDKVPLEPTQDHEQQQQLGRVDATQIRSVTTRKKVFWETGANANKDVHEASPTGVDELPCFDDDKFTEVHFKLAEGERGNFLNQHVITPREEDEATDNVISSKPPLAPPLVSSMTEESEFIASEDWDLDEDTLEDNNSVNSGPFGSFTMHEDALDLLNHRDVIELRPSLESDCGASSSIVSGSVVSSSVAQSSDYSNHEAADKPMQKYFKNEDDPMVPMSGDLFGMSVEEEQESRGSKDTCTSLGSFSQIFCRESGGILPSEGSDSESDAPGDYFDFSHEVEDEGDLESNQQDVEEDTSSGDVSLRSDKAPNLISTDDLVRKGYKESLEYVDPNEDGDASRETGNFSRELFQQSQTSHRKPELGTESKFEDDDSSGETPDFVRDLAELKASMQSSKPWAKTDQADIDYELDDAASDLLSAPSASFASSDSRDDEASSLPDIYLGEPESSDANGYTEGMGDAKKINAPMTEDFDNLNNFWVHEWKEMAEKEASVAAKVEINDGIKSKSLSDPDSDQSRSLLQPDEGDDLPEDKTKSPAAAENVTPAVDNICRDGDGNAYLKIFDLDSGRETYEVIDRHCSYDLETVEECSSEEEENEQEDATPDKEASPSLLEKIVNGVIDNEQYGADIVKEINLGEDKDSGKEVTSDIDASQALSEKTLAGMPEFQLKELDDLWCKIDEYQEALAVTMSADEAKTTADNTIPADGSICRDNKQNASSEQPSPPIFNEQRFRRVKSSKKRHVHVKMRAIVKARSERAKFSLTYLEKGSHVHHENRSILKTLSEETDFPRTSSMSGIPHLSLDTSLDGILTKALDAITAVEHVPSQVEDEELAFPPMKKSPMKKEDLDLFEASSTKSLEHATPNNVSATKSEDSSPLEKNKTTIEQPDGSKRTLLMIEDDHSLASKSLSVADTLTSWDIDEVPSESADDDGAADGANAGSYPLEKDESEDKTPIQHSPPCRPELKKGQSNIFAKLYDENVEMAEILSETVSKLEKVSRKLAQVTLERDEILATARFEI